MSVFAKLNELTNNAIDYIDRLERLTVELEPHRDKFADFFNEIGLKAAQFKKQIDDFNLSDRKFRIGIMGEVKAGKSSFLNTLLFDGMHILPKANTPKTAALTEITYDIENRVEVEYYTKSEWAYIVERSKSSTGNPDEKEAALELVTMALESDLDVSSYLDRKETLFRTNNIVELKDKLDAFVGSNGHFTPVVKLVKLYISDDRLKDIVIIDTPGLNDPVISRTEKTRECMKFTDIVFFLSRNSTFLTEPEITLLLKQIPQSGVSSIVLVCSMFDTILSDAGWNTELTYAGLVKTERQLRSNRAEQTLMKYYKDMAERGETGKANNLKSMSQPYIVSSLCEDLYKKNESDYTENELYYYNQMKNLKHENKKWSDFELNKNILSELSGFVTLREKLASVIRDKDNILSEKFANLIPDNKSSVIQIVENIKKQCSERKDLLANKDKAAIEKMFNASRKRVTRINLGIETVLNDLISVIDKRKNDAIDRIRQDLNSFNQISEKTGTDYRDEQAVVSTAKWWNPFTWGSKAVINVKVPEYYKYVEVNDAVENVYNFSNEVVNIIENEFNNLVDMKEIKKQIIKNSFDNMEVDSEEFDPDFYKLAVERTISRIKKPDINIEVENASDLINSNFSGNARDQDIGSLKQVLSKALRIVLEDVKTKLESEILQLKNEIEQIKKQLQTDFTKDINDYRTSLVQELVNKDNEIDNYDKLIKLTDKKLLDLTKPEK